MKAIRTAPPTSHPMPLLSRRRGDAAIRAWPAPWLLAAAVLATAGAAHAERGAASRALLPDQRLVGDTYRRFETQWRNDCIQACSIEGRCRSWTFKYPVPRGALADELGTCELKAGIPRTEFARGFVSGVKPPPPAVRAGRDRPPPRGTDGTEQPPPPVVQR